MTAFEAYELTTQGGGTDFARLIDACRSFGSYCLIGGLAVNAYVDPVYTLDADTVMIASALPGLTAYLQEQNFQKDSKIRIQFTTDERYQSFPDRSIESEVLGIRVKVASLEDVTQGKLWAYSDQQRRFSKRKKDELDLIRLAEAYPKLKAMYPVELRELIDRG